MPHILRLFAVFALLILGAGNAVAGITVTGMAVNGSNSVTVQTNTLLQVRMSVQLTNNTDWRSTRFSITPGGFYYCDNQVNYVNDNGTITVTYSGVPAPATAGTYSLTVIAHSDDTCGNAVSDDRTLTNSITTVAPAPALNHVRIEHDGSGLNCSPEVVTLRACSNASCSTLFTGSVTVDLGVAAGDSWSADPVTFSGGQTTVNLSRSSGGTATLSGTVTSPTAGTATAQCYQNGVAGDCGIDFGDASCQLDAVEAGQNPNTPIFTRRVGAPVTLDILTLLNGAITANRSGAVTAQIVEASGNTCSTTPLSAVVSASYAPGNGGRRSFVLTPSAASANARVRLVSNTLVQCSSDNFAVRPASLTVSATGAGADATGASATASPVLAASAGKFGLAAAGGTGYTGTPVIAPLRVSAADVNTGVAGVPGTLAGGFSAASGGNASGNAFTYSEVGYFKLLSYGVYDNSFTQVDSAKGECFTNSNLGTGTAPADPNVTNGTGRIGCYFGSSESAFFGRFVPARFAMSTPYILHRSDLPAACTGSFNYMGEKMTAGLTLAAHNADGDKTANYTGRFARLDIPTQMGLGAINDPTPTTRTVFPVCGATAAHPCITPDLITGTFAAGQASVAMPLTVFRPATAVGPFENFKLGVAPADADGVKLASYDIDTVNAAPGAPNHALVGSSRVRYGRLNIDNAYGSELLNLTMRVSAQYYNGTGYATNTLDSCTVLASSGFAMGGYRGGINAANMNMTRFASGSTMVNGVGKIVLARPAPTSTSKGSVNLIAPPPQAPTVPPAPLPPLPGVGRATFGVYKAGPVIYLRETY